MLGAVLSVAFGVVQLLGGDWLGALWSLVGVALGYWAYRLKRG